MNLAAMKGRPEVVKYLVGVGANLVRLDKMQRTVMHYALQGGNVELIKFLVLEKKCDIFCIDR